MDEISVNTGIEAVTESEFNQATQLDHAARLLPASNALNDSNEFELAIQRVEQRVLHAIDELRQTISKEGILDMLKSEINQARSECKCKIQHPAELSDSDQRLEKEIGSQTHSFLKEDLTISQVDELLQESEEYSALMAHERSDEMGYLGKITRSWSQKSLY